MTWLPAFSTIMIAPDADQGGSEPTTNRVHFQTDCTDRKAARLQTPSNCIPRAGKESSELPPYCASRRTTRQDKIDIPNREGKPQLPPPSLCDQASPQQQTDSSWFRHSSTNLAELGRTPDAQSCRANKRDRSDFRSRRFQPSTASTVRMRFGSSPRSRAGCTFQNQNLRPPLLLVADVTSPGRLYFLLRIIEATHLDFFGHVADTEERRVFKGPRP